MRTILGLVAVLSLVLIFFLTDKGLIRRCLQKPFFNNARVGGRIRDFILRFQDCLRDYISLKSCFYLAFLSIVIWITLYLFFVTSCKAIHAQLSYYELLFIFLMMWPVELLPIRGAGNIGTHELGWVIPLSLLGYSQPFATLIAFGTHAVLYINLLVIVGLMLVVFRKNFIDWLIKEPKAALKEKGYDG